MGLGWWWSGIRRGQRTIAEVFAAVCGILETCRRFLFFVLPSSFALFTPFGNHLCCLTIKKLRGTSRRLRAALRGSVFYSPLLSPPTGMHYEFKQNINPRSSSPKRTSLAHLKVAYKAFRSSLYCITKALKMASKASSRSMAFSSSLRAFWGARWGVVGRGKWESGQEGSYERVSDGEEFHAPGVHRHTLARFPVH